MDSILDKFAKMGLKSNQQGVRKSFAELRQEAEKLAAGFLSLGLRKGDRLGIWGPNTYEWYITQLAAGKAGLILVSVLLTFNLRHEEGSLHLRMSHM